MANHTKVIPRSQSKVARAERKSTRQPRMSALVLRACELMSAGEFNSITACAKHLNCSREHLTKQLNRDHVKAFLRESAKLEMVVAAPRAARTKVEMLAAESEHVRNQAASDILAYNGLHAPKFSNETNVNVNVCAGYEIIFDIPQDGGKLIEAPQSSDTSAT